MREEYGNVVQQSTGLHCAGTKSQFTLSQTGISWENGTRLILQLSVTSEGKYDSEKMQTEAITPIPLGLVCKLFCSRQTQQLPACYIQVNRLSVQTQRGAMVRTLEQERKNLGSKPHSVMKLAEWPWARLLPLSLTDFTAFVCFFIGCIFSPALLYLVGFLCGGAVTLLSTVHSESTII